MIPTTSIAEHEASADSTVSTGLAPVFDSRSSKSIGWPDGGLAWNALPPRCSSRTDLWVGTRSACHADFRRCPLGVLGQELFAVEARIQAAVRQELAVRATLDDPTSLIDQDPVG